MAKAIKPKKEKIPDVIASPVNSNSYEPSDFVIKEIMHQKGCSREDAIRILKNPAPHK